MGRQNRDTAVVGSSIALLQERFKQLQRLKEMREEKQLLMRLLPRATDASMESFATSDHDPLALGLNPGYRVMEVQQLRSGFFEKPDVDTSLRL